MKSFIQKIIKIVDIEKKSYIFNQLWCFFCLIMYTIFSIIFPSFFSKIVDIGIARNDKQAILQYSLQMLLKYGTIADEEVIKKQILKKAFCKLNQAIDCVKELPNFGWKRFITFTRDIWCQKWKI